MPVVIKTLGVFDPKTLAFVRELGRRIRQETGEEMAWWSFRGRSGCSVGVMHFLCLQ